MNLEIVAGRKLTIGTHSLTITTSNNLLMMVSLDSLRLLRSLLVVSNRHSFSYDNVFLFRLNKLKLTEGRLSAGLL